MGTKAKPGANDCYDRALLDEPRFTLLARDPIFSVFVSTWASKRENAINCGDRPDSDHKIVSEAYALAQAGQLWRKRNIASGPNGIPLWRAKNLQALTDTINKAQSLDSSNPPWDKDKKPAQTVTIDIKTMRAELQALHDLHIAMENIPKPGSPDHKQAQERYEDRMQVFLTACKNNGRELP